MLLFFGGSYVIGDIVTGFVPPIGDEPSPFESFSLSPLFFSYASINLLILA